MLKNALHQYYTWWPVYSSWLGLLSHWRNTAVLCRLLRSFVKITRSDVIRVMCVSRLLFDNRKPESQAGSVEFERKFTRFEGLMERCYCIMGNVVSRDFRTWPILGTQKKTRCLGFCCINLVFSLFRMSLRTPLTYIQEDWQDTYKSTSLRHESVTC